LTSERESIIREYYQGNKDWIREIAQCGDPIVRAVALAILKRGASDELEQSKKA